MGFQIVRDLLSGAAPQPIDVIYNTNLDANGTDKRYAGSFVKFMDYDDINHGTFFTFAGLTTLMENVAGILGEEVAASTTYLPDATAATGDWVYRKMYPVGPTTIVRGEYTQYDAAGADSTDTGFSGSAASNSITTPNEGTADCNIGAWLYFVDGDNAGYLHYLRDGDGSTTGTLRTALVNAVASGNKVLVIQQAHTRTLLMNETYTGIKSDYILSNRTAEVFGLAHYVRSPGKPLQMLTLDLDGCKIDNAKFYHDFIVGGPTEHSVWQHGVKIS